LKGELQHVFVQLHKKQLEQGFGVVAKERKKRGDYTPIHVNDEIEIVMPCSSIATYEDLRSLYADKIMSQETFAKHTFALMGLSQDDITITPPDEEPTEKKKPVKDNVF